MLKAEGFSYREICAMTGWSYTKVNRLLTEGRRAFLRRVSGIQRGAECARYEPLLSALADGEASTEDLARLRPHMQTCLSCRAALREYRALPERVASVVPPAALVSSDGAGPLRSLFESIVGGAQGKTAAMGERLHAAAELATGQKLAAVAASAAALAGGGTAIDELANHRGPPPVAAVAAEPATGEPAQDPLEHNPPEPVAETAPPEYDSTLQSTSAPVPAPLPAPPPPPDPAREFEPVPASTPATTRAAPPPATPGGFEAGGGGGSGSGSGSGEFAP